MGNPNLGSTLGSDPKPLDHSVPSSFGIEGHGIESHDH